MSVRGVTYLSNLAAGEIGIVHWLTGRRGFVTRLAALGFTPGTKVTMVQNFGRGPIIVIARDTRIALGRGEARKVQVTRKMG